MPAIVVPFKGLHGKRRLRELPPAVRSALVLAMLEDVLAACTGIGTLYVVTADPAGRTTAERLGAEVVADPGRGQGAAVARALEVAGGAALVVNSDLGSVVAADVHELWRRTPKYGIAVAAAADGTTNALGLSDGALFAPLYGRASAARFRAHAASHGAAAVPVVLPGLAHDVDTLDDLYRLQPESGARTRRVPVPQPA